ncbi:MAG TPA: hypothetical protein VN634_04365 [Candidatus Limnocylindrales bacterium]|nr:hypothetical protein [Candidatus Limnocylindrales bacterium]
MIELEPRSTSSDASDPDGVRVVARDPAGRRQQRIMQGVALFLAAACAGYVLMPRQVSQAGPDNTPKRPEPRPTIGAESANHPVAASAAGTAAATPENVAAAVPGTPQAQPATPTPRRLTPRRAPSHSSQNADDEPGQQPELVGIPRDVTAAEYIQALHDAGIYEGIGAFNPPGTSPPLDGLAVPEDYVLPEGYVRHYQTTDDGQDIEPILMYSPDYEFFDENGNPVPIPEDRVVPADKAPPGFPIRPIEIPKPREREPGDTGR